MSLELDFTKRKIDQLYDLKIEWKNQSLTQDELITKLRNLRGSLFVEIVSVITFFTCILILASNAFILNPNALIPIHL